MKPRFVLLETSEEFWVCDKKIGLYPPVLLRINRAFPDAELLAKSQADWLNSGPNE